MAELNLLPRKAFEIILNGQTIKGQYSLWSLKRFCDKKNLSLSQLSEALDQDKVSFDDLTLLILCAVEYVSRKEKQPFTYTDIDCCEWIEELGGLQGEKFLALQGHAASEDKGDSEKKNPE